MFVSIVVLNHSNVLKCQQCTMCDHWFWMHDNWQHSHDGNWLWWGVFGWPQFPCNCVFFSENIITTFYVASKFDPFKYYFWNSHYFPCGYGFQNQAEKKYDENISFDFIENVLKYAQWKWIIAKLLFICLFMPRFYCFFFSLSNNGNVMTSAHKDYKKKTKAKNKNQQKTVFWLHSAKCFL